MHSYVKYIDTEIFMNYGVLFHNFVGLRFQSRAMEDIILLFQCVTMTEHLHSECIQGG